MTKFDNYVYLTICEVSLELFHKTRFSTYVNYCRTLNLSLKSGVLDRSETSDIIKISETLTLIYGFDDVTAAKYISEYFDSDRCLEFQKCVLITKEYFKNAFN
jgi:hypothetical protein